MTVAILGGALIGIAVSIMLAFNGRVTGISGIISGALTFKKKDFSWRILFILGLVVGGITLRVIHPVAFDLVSKNMNTWDYAISGFLVGFGTLLGSGCTSGHGVCGISRLSPRSFVATFVFILFGILSVLLFKQIKGEL